jgi:hypothetical protein
MLVVLCLTLLGEFPAAPRAQQGQSDDDEIRKIWDEGLLRQRPASVRRDYNYRRVTPRLPPVRRAQKGKPSPAPTRDAVVGMTVWRLRPSRPEDEVRELVQGPAKQGGEEVSLTAERVEAQAVLNEGEFVRVSIESPLAGYLYVINRELYANGTKGRPMLIFPTERILGGENRMRAGRVVTIPSMKDDPPYFTVRPNPQRKDQTAEQLLIIISDEPLGLPTPAEAQALDPAMVAGWEKRWRALSERLEQVGGAGTGITPEEFAAGGDGRQDLTQGDPAPQTIYHLRVGRGAPVLLSLELTFKRSDKPAEP